MTYEEKPEVMAMKREMEGDSYLCLASDKHSEVKNWKTGEEYEVTMRVKQLSSDLMEDGKVKSKFEIVSVN